MASRSGSMLCPHCGKLIGRDEQHCPFCGAWNPALYGAAPVLQRFFGRQLHVVPFIIGLCVALYLVSLALEPQAIFAGGGGIFNLLSPGTRALYQLGMTNGPMLQSGWWWTLLTAIYLHGGVLHILFNMMWVRNLGPAVDETWGPARAFVIFTVSGAVGFLVSDLFTGTPTIGASGSIFGLLAALIVFGRRHGHVQMTGQLWQWAIVMFVLAFFMSSVNNWAHAGGFLGGWLTASFMRSTAERREGLGIQAFALLLLLATLAGFVLSFMRVPA
ncbi:MAG TPA: rhomboid family intramembrane serine protease [Candidatus Eisenbacteria bacterium]|nr:rhomboid family intramembrane serine protease [Candidatus Eisenbacteria bacterium]